MNCEICHCTLGVEQRTHPVFKDGKFSHFGRICLPCAARRNDELTAKRSPEDRKFDAVCSRFLDAVQRK